MIFRFFKDYTPYFVYYSLFMILGLYYYKTLPEEDAILFFSEHRSSVGNSFFIFCSLMGEFIPYVLATAYFLWKDRKFTLLPLIVAILVMFFSYFIKDYFGHPRPIMVLEMNGLAKTLHLVPGVEVMRGYNSFPSGHTMSAFALFSLLCFTIAKSDLMQMFFFILAALVGVSRVYLVQHFPQDVLFGSFLGFLVAMVVYFFYCYFNTTQQAV